MATEVVDCGIEGGGMRPVGVGSGSGDALPGRACLPERAGAPGGARG